MTPGALCFDQVSNNGDVMNQLGTGDIITHDHTSPDNQSQNKHENKAGTIATTALEAGEDTEG